jgi:hypothetical protein
MDSKFRHHIEINFFVNKIHALVQVNELVLLGGESHGESTTKAGESYIQGLLFKSMESIRTILMGGIPSEGNEGVWYLMFMDSTLSKGYRIEPPFICVLPGPVLPPQSTLFNAFPIRTPLHKRTFAKFTVNRFVCGPNFPFHIVNLLVHVTLLYDFV